MMKTLIISSPQFESEGWMPDCLTGYGADQSPELCIKNIPAGTVTLAITMDDLDHPIKPGFSHWVVWNITPKERIPGGLPKGAIIEAPIHMEQGLGYGKHCYRGPKPPFHWKHRYQFIVYALDDKIQIRTDSKKEELETAMKNHILACGMLIGKYQKHHT